MHELIEKSISEYGGVSIELGCGPRKKDGHIGIDIIDLPGVDIVHNLEKPFSFIDDNTVDRITSNHLLEHIENFSGLMEEIHRILKPEGIHEVTVPHFSNPYYYSDYTHKRFFGLYSFDYMGTKASSLKRQVPPFYNDKKFHIESRYLNFKSSFTLRKPHNVILRKVINLNSSFQELYEEMFCYIFPCAEIKFTMKPLK